MGTSCVTPSYDKVGPRILYHGSEKHLEYLVPMPSRVLGGERAVFATPYRWIAIVFSKRWSDSDFSDFGSTTNLATGEKEWILEEARPGAFDEIFRGNAWLYTLPARDFHGDVRLGMPNVELINFSQVTPLKRELVDVAAELLKSPLIVVRRDA
jgi:hypothetical protein